MRPIEVLDPLDIIIFLAALSTVASVAGDLEVQHDCLPWFNLSQQLSATQPFIHSLSPSTGLSEVYSAALLILFTCIWIPKQKKSIMAS